MKSAGETTLLAERVMDRMTQKVVVVQVSDPLDLVVSRMRSLGISGFPVMDPYGRLAGVISEIDIARSISPVKGVESFPGFLEVFLRAPRDESSDPFKVLRDRLHHLRAGGCMTSPAVTIVPGASLAEAAAIMEDQGINRLPVVGEGRLLGIITRTDIVKAVAHPLPYPPVHEPVGRPQTRGQGMAA